MRKRGSRANKCKSRLTFALAGFWTRIDTAAWTGQDLKVWRDKDSKKLPAYEQCSLQVAGAAVTRDVRWVRSQVLQVDLDCLLCTRVCANPRTLLLPTPATSGQGSGDQADHREDGSFVAIEDGSSKPKARMLR